MSLAHYDPGLVAYQQLRSLRAQPHVRSLHRRRDAWRHKRRLRLVTPGRRHLRAHLADWLRHLRAVLLTAGSLLGAVVLAIVVLLAGIGTMWLIGRLLAVVMP